MKRSVLVTLVVVVLVGVALASVYALRAGSQSTGETLTVIKQPVMYEAYTLTCETVSGTVTTLTYWLVGGITSETTITPTTASTVQFATTTTVTNVGQSMIGQQQGTTPKC